MKATLNLNGVEQDVQVFTPSFNDSQLAVVHLSVLKQLTDLLPKASLDTIKYRIMESISNSNSLPDLLKLLRDEIAFQETVNQIKTVDAEQITVGLDKCL